MSIFGYWYIGHFFEISYIKKLIFRKISMPFLQDCYKIWKFDLCWRILDALLLGNDDLYKTIQYR